MYLSKLQTVVLILFFSVNTPAKVCLIDYTQVINLSFNYENSALGFLPGVNQDRKTMKDLFGEKGQQTNLVDKDIYNKEDILKVFKDKIAFAKSKGISPVDIYFNYAGHGLLTKTGGFAIPLPSTPKNCLKEIEVKFQGDQNESLYRGLYSTTYLNEATSRGLGRIKLNDCSSSRGLGRKENCKSDHFTKTVTVFDDTDPNCFKYFLTSEDLESITKDANLYGFIDSCHSGALTKSKGINVVASAQAHELAADDPKNGGKLFQFARDLVDKYSCSISDEEFDRMNLGHVLNKLPKVHMTPEALPNTESFRGLSRESLENIYFKNQTHALSQTLEKDPSEMGCLTLNKVKAPAGCQNPMQYVHQAKSKIHCGNDKYVDVGEALVITNEFKDRSEYKGYTKNCGRFTISAADISKVKKLYLSNPEIEKKSNIRSVNTSK